VKNIRKKTCTLAIVLAVAVVGPPFVQACCIPGADPEHEGCTAGAIEPGTISGLSEVWEGHYASWTRSGYSDIDHCYDPYVDVAETEFTDCLWDVDCWNGVAWVDHTTLGTNCTQSSYWNTEDSYVTVGNMNQYAVRAWIDDTPANGPGGDDGAVYAIKYVDLNEPYPTNFRQNSWSEGTGDKDGYLLFQYYWDASCGDVLNHRNHLDDVCVRECVKYERDCDLGPLLYDWPEPWTNSTWDPTIDSWDATNCEGGDEHKRGTFEDPVNNEGDFSATQWYQWAYEIPGPPSDWSTSVTWTTLMGPLSIDREVSYDAEEEEYIYEIWKPTNGYADYTIP